MSLRILCQCTRNYYLATVPPRVFKISEDIVGLAKEFAEEKSHDYVDQLEGIQCILQDISTLLATPRNQEIIDNPVGEQRIKEKLSFNPRHILELESWTDQYTSLLPPLSNFILPGGGRISASIHVARTVCRWAERSIVPLTTCI